MSTATLRSVRVLAERGLIAADDLAALEAVSARYAVAITPAVAALMQGRGADDPIARQFAPSAAELATTQDELADPIGDHAHTPLKGIVHRYHDRALLKATHTCPVYCRFCFRREMVGPDGDGTLTPDELAAALAYVAAHPEIREIIVTGGDPFVLSDRRIAAIVQGVAGIASVRTLRWHTRVPVVQPERVTPALVAALTGSARQLSVVVAVHANHAREFSADARAALARLTEADISLLSQSVLLRGVNDAVAPMIDLLDAFEAGGIRPYYLHHGDLAPGTAHFRLPIPEGLALMRELRRAAPGRALPEYVIDLPGGFGKVPVASASALPDGRYVFIDRTGAQRIYPPTINMEKAAAVAG